MIRLPSGEPRSAAERYGLELLVDMARLPPVDDAEADVVRLDIAARDATGADPDLPTCIAHDWYLERGEGMVRVSPAALRQITAVAGAAAEHRTSARDRHDRVPSAENVLVRHGLDTEPVVSQAAARLRAAVIASAGRRRVVLAAPWPDGKRWAAAFTHDLDVVAYWPLFTLLRLAELARKRQLGRAARTVAAALAAVGRDPVGQGIRTVLEIERGYGVASTWFVLCGTPTLATLRAGDLTYRPESPAAAAIIRTLAERQCEIGLHGSFATADRPDLFRVQRARLERLAGRPVAGVRQHFLRMRPGATPHAMLAGGFRFDATAGFADRNGFRLGAADVLPVWDAGAEQPIALEEVPFCWMDRALSKYRGVEEPGHWVADGLALARACRAVEGLWVGVWHPNLSAPLGFPGAPAAFDELIRGIAREAPFLSTLSAVVQWRVARRSVRIRRVAPDGRVEAYTALPTPAPAPLALEDAAGRVLELVWA